MLKITVKDFGPIKEGSLSLRPLTILVGPNNAGKSYLALLVYAFSGIFQRGRLSGRLNRYRYPFLGPDIHLSDEAKTDLAEKIKKKKPTSLKDIPGIEKYINDILAEFIPSLSNIFNEEIQRCFGSKLSDLARNHSVEHLLISLTQDSPHLYLEFALKDDGFNVKKHKWDISEEILNARLPKELSSSAVQELIPSLVVIYALRSIFKHSYYFPAARSGILQGHKALASFVLSQLPLFGIERIEIPTLSGAVVDFISNLLRLERRKQDSDIAKVASFLESEVIKGKIDIDNSGSKFEYPEIFYEANDEKIPLHRASSMVSEMTLIILFLKYVVDKDAFLIIEEPEAHLHPNNQRIFAQAIVKLIRLGVQVLVTTHSDYFVQQLSNFVLLGQTPSEERIKLGYTENDYLTPSDVGCYLFCLDERDGSIIHELKVTQEEGIPQDQFVRIAEEIYDETTRLQLQALERV